MNHGELVGVSEATIRNTHPLLRSQNSMVAPRWSTFSSCIPVPHRCCPSSAHLLSLWYYPAGHSWPCGGLLRVRYATQFRGGSLADRRLPGSPTGPRLLLVAYPVQRTGDSTQESVDGPKAQVEPEPPRPIHPSQVLALRICCSQSTRSFA